jgi:hypothetical protein
MLVEQPARPDHRPYLSGGEDLSNMVGRSPQITSGAGELEPAIVEEVDVHVARPTDRVRPASERVARRVLDGGLDACHTGSAGQAFMSPGRPVELLQPPDCL